MKVIVYPSDKGGCGNYRLRWPGKALEAAGYDIKVSEKMPYVVMNGGQVQDVLPLDADAIVFQRPCSRQIVETLRILKGRGIKIILDFDDDLSAIHRNNTAYAAYNYLYPDMNWKFGMEAVSFADRVVVTTPRLQEVYGGVVMPNTVPERYLSVESSTKPNELVTVGWPGFLGSHPEDLQTTHGAINQALAATRGALRFIALGDQKTLGALGIREREPNHWLPGVNITLYPEFVAQLDIGIAPLDYTPFNNAKSWLKGLEYASLGVAAVVTPTEDNLRLVEAGAAVAAPGPKDWAREVESLIRDGERRAELIASARKFASTQTIEGNVDRWASAWGII